MPVWGAEAIVHLASDGRVASVSHGPIRSQSARLERWYVVTSIRHGGWR
ncbi:MAG: hypothetical protein ACXWWU_00455 [Candidatus Limnocylindria bacterium]